MSDIVYTARDFVAFMKHIEADIPSKYNNRFPNNVGYNHGSYYSWDCWNFVKSILWGWKPGGAVGSYCYHPGLHGLGDWGGWTLLNTCTQISTDFSSVPAGSFLLTADKTHAGTFVGEFTRAGKIYNVIECTGAAALGKKVAASYCDANGHRLVCKGGSRLGTWGWHGLLSRWIDYTATPAPKKTIAEDGSWGMDTTRWTQRLLGTTVDGIVSNQPHSNKKYLPNAYTGSWKFKVLGYKGGSAMVKALQKLIGVTPDGYFGKASVTALQTYLKKQGLYTGTIDGVMGKATVVAWQKYINRAYA